MVETAASSSTQETKICWKCKQGQEAGMPWQPTMGGMHLLCQKCVSGLVEGWERTTQTGPTSETTQKWAKEEMMDKVSDIIAKQMLKDMSK